MTTMHMDDRFKQCILKHEHISNPQYEDFSHMHMAAVSTTGPAQPTTVDLRAKLPPVWDQGNIGSCTAFALCGCFSKCDKSFDASKLFLYYNERYLDSLQGDNAPGIDDGSTISQGVSALRKYGVCSTSKWPYVTSLVSTKPSQAAYTEGLLHQALTVSNIRQDLTQLKGCLQAGFPFAVGIVVFSSFFPDAQGVIPMPKLDTDSVLGGHALCVVGYDDVKQCFLVRNSWGPTWGINGHCYIPYTYILDLTLATDTWKLVSVEVVTPPTPPPVQPKPTPRPTPVPRPRRRIARAMRASLLQVNHGGKAVLK